MEIHSPGIDQDQRSQFYNQFYIQEQDQESKKLPIRFLNVIPRRMNKVIDDHQPDFISIRSLKIHSFTTQYPIEVLKHPVAL